MVGAKIFIIIKVKTFEGGGRHENPWKTPKKRSYSPLPYFFKFSQVLWKTVKLAFKFKPIIYIFGEILINSAYLVRVF